MPELPEVETTMAGIKPHIEQQTIHQVCIHQPKLRWPIEANLAKLLEGKQVLSVRRRAKYLLLEFEHGYLMLHLGMSGKLRVLSQPFPERNKHDHLEIYFNEQVLRFNDPRRFGACIWIEGDPEQHKLLVNLGPEPLTDAFCGDYLFEHCQKRVKAIKNLIMDNAVVVGVGNIYATEALFHAKIHPLTPAKQLSRQQCQLLVSHIKQVLSEAIKQGGTTLKDFTQADGKPGYFAQKLFVYGRSGAPCLQCQALIEKVTIGQRTSSYCPQCQPLID